MKTGFPLLVVKARASVYRAWGVLGVVVGIGLAGCGSSPTAAGAGTPGTTTQTAAPASVSDAEMRKSFQQKTFSIDQVPAKDRERVRAIMEAQKNRTK